MNMIEPQTFLRIAYVANILILLPVCWAMFVGSGVESVFQGTVAESSGLRLLVGSLWSAILIASIAGLVYPMFFAPVLLIQVIYKAIWLAVFVGPSLAEQSTRIPYGVAICFVLIVLIYPFLFWAAVVRGTT